MVTRATSNRRLLKAARLVERSRSFDQWRFINKCGAPGCVIGHYALNTKGWYYDPRSGYAGINGRFFNVIDEADHFGITIVEHRELFDADGCGVAGRSGKRAAAYIRDFVARRREADRAATEAA